MAATIQAKAGVTLLFGISTGIASLTGLITTDDDQEFSSKKTEVQDSAGSTVAIAYFDQMIDIKFTALLISGTPLPLIGADVTISSVKYICEKVVQKEVNTKFTVITIDLKRFSDNLIPN
jgi:hypothetical protein